MTMKMGHGYAIALQHYTQQKEDFLNYLEFMSKETQEVIKNRLENEIVISECSEEQINGIINRINFLIENSSLKQIRQEISNYYKNTGNNKEAAAEKTRAALGAMLSPSWIRKHIIQQLPNSLGTEIKHINSSAFFGKIKQLFNMAMRHTGALDPSAWTKSNISGILYEHAVADGLRKYFNGLFGEFTDVVTVNTIGAQGGRGDIRISLNAEKYNRTSPGSSFVNIGMQIKQIDLEQALTSQHHSEKINVGSSTELLDEFLSSGLSRTVENTMYFLSKGRNVIRAIGEDVSVYGFEHGKIKFTADLIYTLHYEKNFSLGFDKVNSSKRDQAAYIRWVRQR